jgi:hypothetical protein
MMSNKYITLGSGRRVTISSYVKTIKYAKEHPNAIFTHTLESWYPADGHTILAEYRASVHDRINKHGGIVIKPGYNPKCDPRVLRRLAQTVARKCRNCGQPVLGYNPNSDHVFCSDSCRREYW